MKRFVLVAALIASIAGIAATAHAYQCNSTCQTYGSQTTCQRYCW